MTTSDEVLQAISTRLGSIDETLNRIASLQEQNNEILQRNTDILQTNTGQLGSISEKLTSIDNKIDAGFDRLAQRLDERFDQIASSFEDLKEVTRMQSGHIDRLMSITETLIQQRVA